METKQFNFQISTELKELLDEAANKKNTTMSQYLTDLLVEDLKGSKRKTMSELDDVIEKANKFLLNPQNIFCLDKKTEWDYNGIYEATVSKKFFGTQNDWNQTLITKINEKITYITNIVNEKGCKHIFIYSPQMMALFESLEYFKVNKNWESGMSNESVGTLGSRYLVFFKKNVSLKNRIDIICSDSPVIGEYIYVLNLPEIKNKQFTWDRNESNKGVNFFGTQKDWENTLLNYITNHVYALYDNLHTFDIEVFSTKMFDMFMYSDQLMNVKIDRNTQRSFADFTNSRHSIFLDELNSEKENIIRILIRPLGQNKNSQFYKNNSTESSYNSYSSNQKIDAPELKVINL